MGRSATRRTLVAAGLALGFSSPAPASILAAYVVLGVDGAPSARVVTDAAACPVLTVDGGRTPMRVRAPAATLPLRPTASKPALSKPSAFPVTVCEAAIRAGAKRAEVEGRRLPLAPRRIDRIAVIGDTGCRVKASDNAAQACDDPRAYPFATVAARVAAWKPDVIVHVGDYLYRETPCPAGLAGCAGSPWGYGWDAWDADFFTPAAPLLAAAPLILARGNHENCLRAGQGWYRLLDARPLTAGHDCNDAERDFEGDYGAPYAVPLGGGDQIVVMDLAIAGNAPLAPDDPRARQFRAGWTDLRDLAAKANSTIMVTHKPVLAFAARKTGDGVQLLPGNQAIQSAFAAETSALFPAGVDLLLAGHIHLWEQLSFAGAYPSQFVTGFSGTQEDIVPLPRTLPPGVTPAPGAIVDRFSSWIDGFGYMTMERAGPRRWNVQVWNVSGRVVNRCRIDARSSACDLPQVQSGEGP